jgi:hypothetical protein
LKGQLHYHDIAGHVDVIKLAMHVRKRRLVNFHRLRDVGAAVCDVDGFVGERPIVDEARDVRMRLMWWPRQRRPDMPERYRGIVSENDDLAAFSALGGKLTWGEFARLLGYRDEQALSRAVLALPARQRQVVGLCQYTGLSELQAARALHISKGAVRSHLARGLQTLRHPPET